MHGRLLACAFVTALLPIAATADPVVAPGAAWEPGQGRAFELLWNGQVGTLEIEGVGTSLFTSLEDCCADTFDRVRDLNPGAELSFSGLVLNWSLPVSVVIEGGLDWNLLAANGFDNLRALQGTATLERVARQGPMLQFALEEEGAPTEPASVPEPALLILVGLGATLAARRIGHK